MFNGPLRKADSGSGAAHQRCMDEHEICSVRNKKGTLLGEAGCLTFGVPGFRGGEAPGPDEKRAPLPLVPGVWLRQWISSLSARAKQWRALHLEDG